MSATREAAAAYLGRGWQPVRIPAGRKGPIDPGWQNRRYAAADFDDTNNVGVLLGASSGNLVDIDLDSAEAIRLADLYLPETGALFGRPSKPRAHRLYIAHGAAKEAFADPESGETLLELRAAGEGGAGHQTVFPPSIADGERREWCGDTIEPALVSAKALRTATAWLAIGCVTARYVSEHAAQRPGNDLPDLLLEADRTLGRAAYRWLGWGDPDAPRFVPKRHEDLSATEVTLWDLAGAIPNNALDWESWNAFGLAFHAASGGSDEGFHAFDLFSAQSSKYVGAETIARWRHYDRSPPSKSGVGKLIAAATAAGWRSERRNGNTA
jgi:Bifunctional DNA primase/polymerase, N-terminal/Primase C terminal 2 (PriCT-2)